MKFVSANYLTVVVSEGHGGLGWWRERRGNEGQNASDRQALLRTHDAPYLWCVRRLFASEFSGMLYPC
jgi:hypothetical protein